MRTPARERSEAPSAQPAAFDEAMANKARTCDKLVPLSEGGTLHVDPHALAAASGKALDANGRITTVGQHQEEELVVLKRKNCGDPKSENVQSTR